MRAVIVHEFGEPQSLRVEAVPDPRPGPGELVIDVEATAVNYVDLLVIAGKYQFLPARPFTPGKLPAGIVSALGPEVSQFCLGDRVLTTAEQGGYAEKAIASAAHTFRIPGSMSFQDAASMALAFDTAWFALRERARIRAGETVLVLGASGSVGIAAVQLARAFGARVLAGISNPDKAELVRQAGAHETVDLTAPNIHDALRDQVHALTGKSGADIVIDPLGDVFFGAALRALSWCGRLVVIGFAAGAIPTLKANYLLLKNIEVSGLQVSDYRKRMPQRMAQCFSEIFDLFEQGKLEAPQSRTVPLEDFAGAMEQIRHRRAEKRLILVPAPSA